MKHSAVMNVLQGLQYLLAICSSLRQADAGASRWRHRCLSPCTLPVHTIHRQTQHNVAHAEDILLPEM